MILWISFLILLSGPVPCKELIVEPHSSDEPELKNTQDASTSTTNSNLTLFDSSGTCKETAFSRLKKAALSPLMNSEIQLKRRPSPMELPDFIGSNLFDGDRKDCFSSEDVSLLAARQKFETAMIPQCMPPTILDDKSVSVIMRYFSHGHLFLRRMKDGRTSRVLRKAFFDTFGGFLHHYLLPVVKMSFYVGDVQLKTVRKVLDYYQKCRFFLNTIGNGWRSPYQYSMDDVKSFSPKSILTDEKETYSDDFCVGLNLLGSKESDIVDENMIVRLPRIDLEDKDGYLGNIWLPYERKTTYSLRSSNSAFLLVKFYKKVTLCYWQKRIPRDAFDMKFKQWISENLLGHIFDEEFYPSLGGLISLYKHLHSPEEVSNNTYTEDDDENVMYKLENRVLYSIKKKRKSSKYIELESKSKSASACDRADWLLEVHKPELLKTAHKKHKYKYSKSRKDKLKNNDKMKKYKKKEGACSKWINWFGDDNSSKNSPKNTDSKLFENGGWWETLKNIIKYVILLLLILFILCVFCKLISLCMDMILGVEGSIGGDCFSVMWNLITEFFKQSYQFIAMLFAFVLEELSKCCTKAKNFSQTNKKPVEKSPRRPKITMHKTKSKESKSQKPKNDLKAQPKHAKDLAKNSSQTNTRKDGKSNSPKKKMEKNSATLKKDSKKPPPKTKVKSASTDNDMGKNTVTFKKDTKQYPAKRISKSASPEKNVPPKKDSKKPSLKTNVKSPSPEMGKSTEMSKKTKLKDYRSPSSQTSIGSASSEKKLGKNTRTAQKDSKKSSSQTRIESTSEKNKIGKNTITSQNHSKKYPSNSNVKTASPEKTIERNIATSKKDAKQLQTKPSVKSASPEKMKKNAEMHRKKALNDSKSSPSQPSIESASSEKMVQKNTEITKGSKRSPSLSYGKNKGEKTGAFKKGSRRSPSQSSTESASSGKNTVTTKNTAKHPIYQPDFTITITKLNRSPQTSRKGNISLTGTEANKKQSESKKRLLGGEYHEPIEMSSDSSNSPSASKESKGSWKTFYDF